MVDHIFHISIAVTAAWQCVIDAGGGAAAILEDCRLERAYLSAPFSGLGKLLHTDLAKRTRKKKSHLVCRSVPHTPACPLLPPSVPAGLMDHPIDMRHTHGTTKIFEKPNYPIKISHAQSRHVFNVTCTTSKASVEHASVIPRAPSR